MKRCLVVCAVTLLPALLGCPVFDDEFGVADQVSDTVATVQSRQVEFDESSNPICDVNTGTTVNPINAIDGCWGRYSLSTEPLEDGDEERMDEAWAVLCFDLEAETFAEELLVHFDPPAPPWPGVGYRVLTGSFEVINASTIRRHTLTGHFGAVQQDDSITFNYGMGVNTATHIGEVVYELATVDGMYLKTKDCITDTCDEEDIEDMPSEAECWVRLE